LKSTKEKNNMNSQYEMDVLRTIVSDVFNVEIVKRTNKRDAVSARKIFSKILNDRGYTKSEIGRYLKKDHSTIVHYMYDVDAMIKYTDGMAKKYIDCKDSFKNCIGETSDEENKSIVSLKLRIDELLLDREELKEKLDRHKRLMHIINLIDYRTPVGEEDFILKKIRLMFNGLKDYGEQLE
jgi:hypothetical protein